MARPDELTSAILSASRPPGATFSWRAYSQLVRLPNVFTAFADITLAWLGALATGTPATHWPAFALLLASSACLYCSGMVWNDYFDVEQDRRERPFRPLPSGRVSRKAAAFLGSGLMGAGLAFAAVLGGASLLLASILAAAILLYDGWLKRTWAGPLAMGLCRFLNVLLGLTVATPDGFPWGGRLYLALIVGLYIVGVTWFARTEARTSSRSALAGALGVMLAALLLAQAVPVWVDRATASALFLYLLVGLGFFVGIPAGRAIQAPRPMQVQAAVKRALQGLVILDAVLATALIGVAGLYILLLLLPVLYLGRWLYST
jgi:4-hydroxybenzoate polyprenyltransferase